MEGKIALLPPQWATSEPSEGVLRKVGSSSKGLQNSEATDRLIKYELNVLPETGQVQLIEVFARQFVNLLVILLIIGLVISVILGDITQAWAIGIVVMINAIIGTVQEYRAETAMQAFKKLLPRRARVRRDGVIKDIHGSQVAIGDIVLLSAGDIVPADMRILHQTLLSVNESTLTGESEAKEKHALAIKNTDLALAEMDNLVFSGTSIVQGESEGVVFASGRHTVIGAIAESSSKTVSPPTPLEKEIQHVGFVTLQIAAGLAVVIAILSWIGNRSVETTLFTMISAAIAVVPEGLAATVSVTLGIGAIGLLRRKVITRRLPAVETLGSVSVICTDKTGTLTENKIKLAKNLAVQSCSQKVADEWGNRVIALCQSVKVTAKGAVGDAVDVALYGAISAKQHGLFADQFTKIAELPFDNTRKQMSVIVQEKSGQFYCLTKGSPLALEEHLKEKLSASDHQKMSEWADGGFKILLLAFRQISAEEWQKYQTQPENFVDQIEHNLSPISLLALDDPPRAGVKQAVAESRQAGIRTIMVTGDWSATAKAIGQQVGLYSGDPTIITGKMLNELPVSTLAQKLKQHPDILFAEIDPSQKQKIVQALRQNGAIVAMTGDGVNDAPALKAADIGIAMGQGGTEVAREAADMVLSNDDYPSIVAAVREGRVVYDNIKKFVFFEYTANTVEMFAVLAGLMLNLPAMLLPIQILVIDLWIGLFPSLALGVDPASPNIMDLSPRSAEDRLLSHAVLWRVFRNGLLVASGAVFGFWLARTWGEGDVALTVSYATLSLSIIFLSFHARSTTQTLLELARRPNHKLNLAVLVSVIMLLIMIYLAPINDLLQLKPLSAIDWLVPISTVILALAVEDLIKKFHSTRRSVIPA